jgi:TrmH family RNA methyltransferase
MDICLIEPHYPGNAGRILRTCINFGIKKLIFYKPKFSLDDLEFIKSSANAIKFKHIISIENSLNFLKKYSLIVGTSCKRKEKDYYKRTISLETFIKKGFPENTVVLFGREPSGLKKSEINLCDYLVYIPTSEEYPSLNLSISVGIFLYRVFVSNKEEKANWSRKKFEYLLKISKHIIKNKFKNWNEVYKRFKRIITSGVKDEIDINILIGLLKS